MCRRRALLWGLTLASLVLAAVGIGWETIGAQGPLGPLPTPRGQLGGPMPLQVTPGPPAEVATEEPAATEEAGTPGVDGCDVEPRSLEELFALATPLAEGATPPPSEDAIPAGLGDGEAPEAETVTGIRATLDELAACIAAGEGLRALALFSDDFVLDLFAMRRAGLTPAEIERFGETEMWAITIGEFPVVRDEDLRVLDDGRVGAVLRLAEEGREPMRGGADVGGYVVFVEAGGRWLIDGLRQGAAGAVTPEATAAGDTGGDAGAALPEPVAAAVADAAAQLGVGVDEVTVVSMERREWPDAGLGCPQPGGFYAQVITPGYLVVIQGAGRELEYHTDEGTNVVLCVER